MTTAKDLAASLGLSVSTVGRALADDPRISAETKARVARAAENTGYIANRAARMMRGASSDVIGVVVPDISNSFYATIAHALSETLARNQYQLMLGETADDRTAELRQIRGFAAAQVAGAIVVPTALPTPATVRLLQTLPHVQLLRNSAALSQQWFGIDDERSLRMATEHLTALGHRRIAFVGGTADLPTGAARQRGYQEALAAEGLPIDPTLIELGPPSSVEHGRSAVARLIDRADPPTGIVTGSVQATRGVLEALLARGVDVPDEVSVVGFGDEAGWSWWGPGLTTIALPIRQLARTCALWLLDRLANPAAATALAPFSSISPGVLTVRGSTSPPTL
ncbi:LacI family DNA-binding transcriptional regulator [Nocardia sp. CA-120079]|uniref:LacI family DNA-binding transcriptional regulator n=1 Tax=Nocardia sp. CA-120079 TaxID=3239974 RepID=UPI003D996A16